MTYALITFAIIMSIYAFGNLMLYTLPVVEAGPISGIKRTGIKRIPKKVSPAFMRTKNGRIYKYRRFIIQGVCMIEVGLNPSDIVSVRMFNDRSDKESIRQGDIALIFLNDTNFRGYKLRIIDSVDNGMATTFYYGPSGEKIMSSRSHSISDIKGIVDQDE